MDQPWGILGEMGWLESRGIIGIIALYNKRKQSIKWQTNGPLRLLGNLWLHKAWSTGRPSTGVMRPLEAAASTHWLKLTGQRQKTNGLKEGTRRSGSGPREAVLHHSVNYQSWGLTQSRVNFRPRRGLSKRACTTSVCHPQHGFTGTTPVWKQGLVGFLEIWACPSSHMHTNKMTATDK